MSGSRDRLGLLLPIPALLVAGSAQARIPGATPPSDDRREVDHEAVPADPVSPSDSDDVSPELASPKTDANDAPPSNATPSDGMLAEARAFYDRGRTAFEEGRYPEAGADFERAAAMTPEFVLLHLQAAIAFRHAVEAEHDAHAASELCTAVRRNAEAVIGHPQATPEQIEQARAESVQADAHCTRVNEYAFVPCLSVIETPETFGPCLTPPLDPEPRGCAHRRDGPTAMLGGLLLLGLRSRRRRDAVERMADRLPPDVADRLRRNSPPNPDQGEDEDEP